MDELTQNTEAPAEVAAPESAVEAPQGFQLPPDALTESKPAEPVAPAYQPNYKYKVKGQEFEIDEEVRPLIKDAAAEAKYRRLFEKANGLDHVIQDKEQLSKQYNEYKSQNEPIMGVVQEAFADYQRGDLEQAFKKLGIPEKDLFKYVYGKLQQEEMPAAQRDALEKAKQYERENLTLKSQYEQTQSQYQQMQTQALTQQLELSLSQPEISQIANAYDQAQGNPGAFRRFVAQNANLHFQNTGVILPAQEAVAMAAKYFPQLSQAQAPSQVQAPQVVAPQGVPVIPVARGGGVSPVKKKITSVADLEKAYAELS